MDNMLEHPGTELQLLIKEKGLTQKAFASILGKKVSEVNELLKGKRNITIQRDYLLHQTLGTPIKYWILKQIDYDYSLLDIEETEHNDVILNDSEAYSASGEPSQQTGHSERSEESIGANASSGASAGPAELGEDLRGEEDESSTKDSSSQAPQNDSITQNETETQKTPSNDSDNKIDEDLKNRAKIFRTF